jgi:hypothetical protein
MVFLSLQKKSKIGQGDNPKSQGLTLIKTKQIKAVEIISLPLFFIPGVSFLMERAISYLIIHKAYKRSFKSHDIIFYLPWLFAYLII